MKERNQYLCVEDEYKDAVFNMDHICSIVKGEEKLNNKMLAVIVSGGSSVSFQELPLPSLRPPVGISS